MATTDSGASTANTSVMYSKRSQRIMALSLWICQRLKRLRLFYYAHPYTLCDKGTVERHNGIIRRFIPKGTRIDSLIAKQIFAVENWNRNIPVVDPASRRR